MQNVIPRSISARHRSRLRDNHGLLHDENALNGSVKVHLYVRLLS